MKDHSKKKEQAGKTAKKTSKTGRGNTRKASLSAELAGLLDDLDEAGLEFLIQQARVLLHNLQVEKVNREISKLEQIDRPVRSKDQATSRAMVDIEEAADGSHFVLILNQARKFLQREEMRNMVQVCRTAGNAREGASRLFRWFSRNRQDVLVDGGLKGSGDPQLGALYRFIVSNYTVQS